MSSMFSPFVGDNSGKTSLSTKPGIFWSITPLCCWGQCNCMSPALLCPVQTGGCTDTSLTSPVAAPPVTWKQIQVEAEPMWDPGPTARPHISTALLQRIWNLPTSQLCHGPRAGQSCPSVNTHLPPPTSQLKQQQCLNAETKVVYSKDSYKALSKSSIFEKMPSSLKLLTYLQ